MKKKLLILGLAIVSGVMAYSASLEELVGSERAALLKADKTINEAQYRKPAPVLTPNMDYIRDLIAENMKSLDPSLFVECLRVYKKPDGTSRPAWSEAERTALYNQCLALSSLAGIEYFSTSRGEMRTFYESSVLVDGPESKNPQKDPVYSIPPRSLTLYARQQDLTFGDNIYRYDYSTRPEAFVFIQENMTAMKSGIITMVGRNKLRSVVAVIDAEEYLLIYVASMAKAASIPGIGQRVGKSFSTRADAILTWFTGRADIAFGR
ncbi:hypothetical protein LJC14_05755 [Treponema sp. OttesenSCG-928-L16]|nr:hypothetical protein [Treponema sp. OttesenSCG-928-L16]